MDRAVVEARASLGLQTMAHRGPDDEGMWADADAWLGHRRLAIIDLTSGGHQPMVHRPTGVVISYNGEIYNYLELRGELEMHGFEFRTGSDTEVLLAAYLRWGRECLTHFNGMWAFLLWDPRSRTAFFARDRLGVKPLYFAMADGGLSVASEPKALLCLHPQLRRVDESSLFHFLADGQLYTRDSSFYRGIQMLRPGHYATFTPGDREPNVERFWRLTRRAAPMDHPAAVAAFSDLFLDAVRLRMRSDVPVGFTLSGGLDSSAIVRAAEALTPQTASLHAFTSVYSDQWRGLDERRWARLVAERSRSVDLELVEAVPDDWLAVLRRIAWHMDGPGYSPAVFPLWRIMERMRVSAIPVVLEGQGADELLGGYPQYAALSLWGCLAAGRFGRARSDLRRYASTFGAKRLFLWLARERAEFAVRPYRERVGALGVLDRDFVRRFRDPKPPRPAGNLNDRLAADLTRDILPGLLQYGDAISMAHSIESRLPFLDYRVVEFVASLPAESKVGHGQTKRLLRDHLRSVDLAVIADRMDKKGYPTPADAWLRVGRGALLRDLLLSPASLLKPYTRPVAVERLIDHHAAGRGGAGNHLYRLLATELWLRTCLAAPGTYV